MLLFVDGIGIGSPGRDNPFSVARLPVLTDLLEGRRLDAEGLPDACSIHAATKVVSRLDSRLGIPGRPQSGTGQTALFTGLNAPALFGRHFGPWVPTPLRNLFETTGFLASAVAAGRRAALLSAVRRDGPIGGIGRRPAAAPLAAVAAGVTIRDVEALRRGEAVASSFANDRWRRLDPSLPPVDVEEGGRRIAGLTEQAEISIFAHYDTDIVGHARSLPLAVDALERLDRALGALLQALPTGTLLLITSDHGNLEAPGRGHTLNPVPLIAVGPGAGRFASARAITDISGRITDVLVSRDSAGGTEK